MAGNRLLYGAVLLCCALFYLAYGEWLSWIVLLAVAGLPWLSLVLSLPAIATFRLELQGDCALTMGETGEVWLSGSSRFPLPPFRGRLCLKLWATGETWVCPLYQELPGNHCGSIRVTAERTRVCDYLGLFAFPAGRREGRTILVRPLPVAVTALPDLQRYTAKSWRPKFGGGFAENHELRLYRPGDSLNQVHWKLSAKTGKLTVREAMEPRRGRLLLTMNLRGTPEERDRKLGRLLWLGNFLLRQEAAFTLGVLTGNGAETLSISEEKALQKAIDRLLQAPLAREGDIRDREYAASWQYHIGGGPDEE